MNRFLTTLSLSFVALTAVDAKTLSVPKQFATIQQAVDAAVDGDVVSVSSGVYAESVSITGKAITLKAKGNATIEPLQGGSMLGPGIQVTNAPGARIEGFTVRLALGLGDLGLGVKVASHGVTLRKLHVVECEQIGISIVGNGAMVDRCVLDGCDGGLSLTGDSALVARTVVKNDGNAGIWVSGIDVTVLKCVVDTVEDGSGIAVLSGQAKVIACTVRNIPDDDGIYVDAEFTDLVGNDVRFVGDGFSGINVVAQSVEVTSNRVRDISGVGIRLAASNGTLTNNVVERAGTSHESGIAIIGAFATATGNKVQDCDGSGIRVAFGNSTFTKNTVERCRLDGIHLDSGLIGVQLVGNVVRSQHGEGFDLRSQPLTMTGNKAQKNRTDFATTVNGFTLPATNVATTYGVPQVD